MKVQELITKLLAIGYTLQVEREGIRFRYEMEGNPPEEAASILSEIKNHKQEIINFMEEESFCLIEKNLVEINRDWTQGALEWMKRTRPGEFKQMMALEKAINRFALSRDMEGLNEVLKDYLDLMVRTARIFKAQKGEIGNLFQQG